MSYSIFATIYCGFDCFGGGIVQNVVCFVDWKDTDEQVVPFKVWRVWGTRRSILSASPIFTGAWRQAHVSSSSHIASHHSALLRCMTLLLCEFYCLYLYLAGFALQWVFGLENQG